MKKSVLISILSMALIFGFNSCKKDPGPGGKATVKGKLYSGNFHSPEYEINGDDIEAEERVYLVYGDREDGYDDDVRTNHDGSFEFKFLRTGTYRIFAYGQDPNFPSSSAKSPVIRTFEVTDSKQSLEINDLIIYKEANKGGTNSIRGKIFVKNWNASFTQLKGEYYGGDEVVYIRYGNEKTYNERIRTAEDGSFDFKNLRKGKYRIYAFSKDTSLQSPSGTVVVYKDIEISGRNQIIEIDDIVINN